MLVKSINGVDITPREFDIISCIVCGKKSKSISKVLNISPKTVDTHIRNILIKLNVRTRDNLIVTLEKSKEYESIVCHYRKLCNLDMPIMKKKCNRLFRASYLALIPIGIVVAIQCNVNHDRTCISNIRIPSTFMLNRETLLHQLNNAYENNKDVLNTIIIGGNSGSGKTTVAKMFVQNNDFCLTWEVNAETKQTVCDSFYCLANAIAEKNNKLEDLKSINRIKDNTDRIAKIFEFVCSYINAYKKWCIIFDNVDDFKVLEKFFQLLNVVKSCGLILITTRKFDLPKNFSYSYLPVEKLTVDEQYKLFCGILYDMKDYAAIDHIYKFLEKVPRFPMDVAIAAYYIKEHHIDFDSYLKNLDKLDIDFENDSKQILAQRTMYDHARSAIIISVFDKLIAKYPEFKFSLFLISMINSQNIPLWFFNELRFDVRKLSIITESGNYFSIHRSMQQICRMYIWNHLSELDKLRFLNSITDMFTQYSRMLPSRYNLQAKAFSASQQRELCQHTKFLIKNLQEINVKYYEMYKAKLLLSILYSHRINDNYSEKLIPLATEILQINEDSNCITGYDLIVLLLETIYYKFSVNDYSDGFSILNRVIKLCDNEDAYGLRVIALSYLAQYYAYNNDFNNSEIYLKQAKDMLCECSGNFATIASVVLSNRYQVCYVSKYIHGERLLSVLPFFNDSLKRLDGSRCFYNNDTAYDELSPLQRFLIPSVKKRLAKLYNLLGKYREALELERDVEFFYSKDDKFSALAALIKIDKGYTLARLGKFHEAKEELEKSIQIKQHIGAFQGISEAFVWLADVNIRLKRFDEVCKCIEKALSLMKSKSTNFEHWLYNLCFYHIAIAQLKLHYLSKAKDSFKRFINLSKSSNLLDNNEMKKLYNENIFEYTENDTLETLCQKSRTIYEVVYKCMK